MERQVIVDWDKWEKKDGSMNYDGALLNAKYIMSAFPEYILCGSLALMYLNLIPKRDVGDLDFICLKENFNSKNLLPMVIDKSDSDNYVYVRVNNGYLCYEVVHKEGWHYNIFVFDDSNNVNFNQDIHGFRTQSSEQILKYKKQYSRPKDLEDLKDIPF